MATFNFESILAGARQHQRQSLDEPTGKQILSEFGLAVPRAVVVPEGQPFDVPEAQLQPPFVLKLVSPDVIHKTEVGGVRLNLGCVQELEEAAAEIRQRVTQSGARVDGWLVEEMADPGVEVVVGGLHDPEFGPLVMVGLGGIFVEVFKDIAFRICPITHADAQDMVAELKSSPLLNGARGGEPLAVEALIDAILRIGGEDGVLMSGQEHIAELDINPLIVSRTGATAVDARFILKQ